MSLHLNNLDALLETAVRQFWSARAGALHASAGTDTGNRGAVTAGKNLDGFYDLIRALVVANGLPETSVYCGTQGLGRLRHTILPGFYRPSKNWDALVLHGGELVAAIELKS